jgi:hypothetical protein
VKQHDEEIARDRLDEVVLPMLHDARETTKAALADAHRDLLRAMRSGFRTRLTQELKVCRRTLEELTKKGTSLEEIGERAAEIDRVVGRTLEITAQGDALVAELAGGEELAAR